MTYLILVLPPPTRSRPDTMGLESAQLPDVGVAAALSSSVLASTFLCSGAASRSSATPASGCITGI